MSEWRKVKFLDLFALPSRNGLTKPSRVRGSGYKMINMGELFSNGRIYDIPMELVPLNDKEKEVAKVERYDLLFARQSLVLEGAGKCSIVMDVSDLTTFESHLIRVRLDYNIANPLFYYYYFSSSLSPISSIVSQCAQAGIKGSDLVQIMVDFPPLHIQHRIATILSSYDSLIENYQKQIKLLEESAQRLYKEWFVDLRFPGHENLQIVDGIPEGWEKKKIFELGKVVTGKTPSTANKANYGGDIPFITIPDMHSGIYPTCSQTLSKQGAESQLGKYIPENSLMVSCIGTAGLVCISETLCQTNQQINSLVMENGLNLYYMYFTFLSLKEHLNNIGSNGATMTNVNKSKFENIEVVVPIDSLLDSFNIIANNTFVKIKNLSLQIRHLIEARDRLLSKLMSGEINVNR